MDCHHSPRLCVGFLLLVVRSRPRPPRLLLPPRVLLHPDTPLSHTHTHLSHTHTTLSHITLSLTHSLTHSLPRSLAHSLTHSLAHSLTHSLTPSLTHSLTHLLTHTHAVLALVARLVPVWRRGRHSCLCGRRGTWRHRPALCVAGVTLMALDWLGWRAWFLPFLFPAFHISFSHLLGDYCKKLTCGVIFL